MSGRVEETIQTYMSCAEAGMSRAVGEITQQLEKDVQAAASGMAATSAQQMQALVGAVRGEL